MTQQKCLFCCRDSKDRIKNNIKSEIRSIFILKELLNVSSSTCVNLLQQSHGSHPSSWFSCCEECSVEITEAEKIFKKLRLLTSQLKKVKSSLKRKLQQSCQEELETESKSASLDNSETVFDTIREEALSKIFQEFGIEADSGVKLEDIGYDVKTENPESETDFCNDEFQNFEYHDTKAVEEIKCSRSAEVPVQRSRFGRLIRQSTRHSETSDNISSPKNNLLEVEKYDDDYSPPKKNIRGRIKRYQGRNYQAKINLKSIPVDGEAKEYKCKHCSLVYPDVNKKNAHENQMHDEKHTFRCSECSKLYTSIYSFERHFKNAHGHDMETSCTSGSSTSDHHKCRHCGKNFVDLLVLKRHERRHLVRSFSCQYCEEKFTTEIRLKLHIFRKHDSTQNPLLCKECGKSFANSTRHRHHVKSVHKKEKDFICELCSAAFTCRSYLLNHQTRFHGNTEELKCKECEKIFCDRFSLKKHIEGIHLGLYKLVCPICGSGKVSKSALKTHILQSHSDGPRPFPCTVCTKTFLTRFHLTNHLRTHTGERPFKCKLCTSAFFDQKKLSRHIENHSKDYRFECKVCRKKFASQHYLSNHIYWVHNKKKSSLPPKKIAAKEQLQQLLTQTITEPNLDLQENQNSNLDDLPEQNEDDVITEILS